MSQDRRDVVRGLPLYKQGASHGENAVKLSSNENPFEPLPSVIEAVTRTLPRFNRYPSMSAEEVRSSIAGHFGVDVSQVAVGAGPTRCCSRTTALQARGKSRRERCEAVIQREPFRTTAECD